MARLKHLFEVVRPHNTKASAALEPLPCSLSSVVPDPEPCSRLTQWKSPHWLERYYDQQRSRPLLATSLLVVIPSLHAYRVHRNTRCGGIVTASKWACFPFCARGKIYVGIALIIPNTHHDGPASSWTSMTRLFSAPLDFHVYAIGGAASGNKHGVNGMRCLDLSGIPPLHASPHMGEPRRHLWGP